MSEKAKIIDQMISLSLLYRAPQIMLDSAGNFVSMEWVWRSREAEELYSQFAEILARHQQAEAEVRGPDGRG